MFTMMVYTYIYGYKQIIAQFHDSISSRCFFVLYFRLIVECVSMSPRASNRQVGTKSAYVSDVESRTKLKSHHRREQKLCTSECLPALFTWFLLLGTSFAYFSCILPEIIILLPSIIPVLIFHCILFVLLCANFVLATFMDPVR